MDKRPQNRDCFIRRCFMWGIWRDDVTGGRRGGQVSIRDCGLGIHQLNDESGNIFRVTRKVRPYDLGRRDGALGKISNALIRMAWKTHLC